MDLNVSEISTYSSFEERLKIGEENGLFLKNSTFEGELLELSFENEVRKINSLFVNYLIKLLIVSGFGRGKGKFG